MLSLIVLAVTSGVYCQVRQTKPAFSAHYNIVILIYLLTYFHNVIVTNAVVTCEIKFFQNYFSLRRRPSEMILFQRVETFLKLCRNYCAGLLQVTNIFQHVHCR